MEYRALIVDDEETYARSIERLLVRRGVQAERAGNSAEALARVRRRHYDLILLDYLLPDGNGLDLIGPLRALRPAPQVLMMTAFGTIENAVEAMRRGAYDYVTKSTAIESIVERVMEMRRVAEVLHAGLATAPASPPSAIVFEPRLDGPPLPDGGELPGLLGDSATIKEARARIHEVARSPDTTVLLVGESGTGKGVAARAIHGLGPRGAEPFVVIDCVSLPATLAESELFGHDKGAFTGADRAKPGRLEAAGRGTVLLDEIGDMELALQGKLLRVLEERTFEHVGGVKPIEMGARIIAASHRDLGALVAEKRFRLDLYHRLMVFPITLPPLRARGDDVILLAQHFLGGFAAQLGKRFAPLGPSVREALLAYDYPGNVRELRNLIERAAILASTGEITVDLLPSRLLDPRPPSWRVDERAAQGGDPTSAMSVPFQPGSDTLEQVEWRLVEEALRRAGGKKARAAELLGISRYALMRRMEKHRP